MTNIDTYSLLITPLLTNFSVILSTNSRLTEFGIIPSSSSNSLFALVIASSPEEMCPPTAISQVLGYNFFSEHLF